MKRGTFAMVASFLLWQPASTAMAADNLPKPRLGQPCAACHLPSAEGVPGAFPPLRENMRALANSAAGRRYIVLAVIHGITGPIIVSGKRFNGAMPAQSLRDDQIVRILNGLLDPSQRPFTTREVREIRSASATVNSAQVARLRPAVTNR